MQKRSFEKIFWCACKHIESDYINREFIEKKWPDIKRKTHVLVSEIDSKTDFESVMIDLFSMHLNVSHSQFITPDLAMKIDLQDSVETAPDFLFPVSEETVDYVYLKVSSLTIPIFSWTGFGPKLKILENDDRPIVLDFRLNAGGSASAVGELLTPFIGADLPFLYSRLATWKKRPIPEIIYPQDEEKNDGNRLDLGISLKFPHAEWRTRKVSEFTLMQKTILLVDGRNYSCGELFAQAMKEHSRCILIGGKTAGAVVGGRDDYDCGYGYRLLLPFVNMISAGGFVLEGEGVSPDVEMSFQTRDTEPLSREEIMNVLEIARND